MDKLDYFIILGKNGKLSKSLNNSLKANNQKVASLSWFELKRLVNSNINLNSFLKEKYKINQQIHNLIFINCLKEQSELFLSLDFYSKLKNKLKRFNANSKYIYLSTYEPNQVRGTTYREIKFIMEKKILKNNDLVLRIGYYTIKNEYNYFQINRKYPIITDLNKIPIMIPITTSEDLTKTLIYKLKENKNNLIRCYSCKCFICIIPKLPFVGLTNLKITEKTLKIPFPLEIISKIIFIFVSILKNLKIKNKFLNYFEKPYSIFLQQQILNDSNF